MPSSGRVHGHDGLVKETIPPEALLAGRPDEMRQLAERLRTIVAWTLPEAIEAVRPGWGVIGYDLPIGKRRTFFLWIWAQTEHVHLGFQRGVLMDDPEGRLEGRGITKLARWLTFLPGDDLDETAIERLILECARVASLSRAERMSLALDREVRVD